MVCPIWLLKLESIPTLPLIFQLKFILLFKKCIPLVLISIYSKAKIHASQWQFKFHGSETYSLY